MSMFDLISSGSRSMGGAMLGGAYMGGAISEAQKLKMKEANAKSLAVARKMVMDGVAPSIKSARAMLKNAKKYGIAPKLGQSTELALFTPQPAKRGKKPKSDMKLLKQHLFGKPARETATGKKYKATPNFIRQLTEAEAKELLSHINDKYGAGFWDSVASFGNAVLEGAPKVLKTVAEVAPYVAMLL